MSRRAQICHLTNVKTKLPNVTLVSEQNTTCEPAVCNYCKPGLGFVCISFVPSVTKVYTVLKIVDLLFILWTQNMFALLQATYKTERASFTMFI